MAVGFKKRKKSQIALEFIIVYSFVLIVFLIVFGIAATERAVGLANDQYSNLNLIGQSITSYIDQAVAAGSGFNATFSLPQYTGTQLYSVYVTSTGIVTVNTTFGNQKITAVAYSDGRNIIGPSIVSGSSPATYSIPSYTGQIDITNYDGVIYIDNQPVTSFFSASQPVLSVPAATEVANFSGALTNNVIDIPNPKQNLAGSLTIGMWINPRNIGAGRINPIAKEYWGEFALTIETNGGLSYYQGSNVSSGTYCSFGALPGNSIINGQWSFIAITRSGNGINANSIVSYLNGNEVNGGTCSVPSAESNTPISIGKQYTGYGYGGYMTDVQIYNSTLDQSEIESIYQRGINATPVNTNSLVVWLPLDGNANDYSGDNNNGVPYNITYALATEASLHSSLQNGNQGFDLPGGIIIPGESYTSYSNRYGNITGYLETNNAIGNFTGIVYNGDQALTGNLIGYWPLELGYGNTIYDLSTKRLNGEVSSGATWVNMPLNATNIQTASFGGTQAVFIPKPDLKNSTAFTLSAWVDLNNNPSFFRNIVASNCFRLEASSYTSIVFDSSPNCGAAGNIDAATGNMLGNESFVAVTYSNGYSNIYFDGNLVETSQSDIFNSNQITAMSIGKDNLSGIGGLDYMFGNISDVQVYSSALSKSHIRQLYNEGLNGTPITGSTLAGWYPLDGNPYDYSNGSGNGVPIGGITYVNKIYYGTNRNTSALHFDGLASNSYVNLGSAETNLTGHLSVAAWIYDTNSSGGYYNYAFSDARDCCGSYNGIELSQYGNEGMFKIWNTSMGTSYEYAAGGHIGYAAWTLLVGTYNGSYVDLYVNGRQVDSVSAAVPPGIPASFNSVIGALGVRPSEYDFNGSVADVQVYNVSLTPAEVEQLYYAGLPSVSKESTSYG